MKYQHILTFLQSFQSYWKEDQLFNDLVDEFAMTVSQVRIVQQMTKRSGPVTGREKNILKEKLALKASALAAAGATYAAQQGDQHLKENFRFSYSDLFKCKDTTLIHRSQTIHQQLLALFPQIKTLGITISNLVTLEETVLDYSNCVHDKRKYKTTLNGLHLEELETKAKSLLFQIDQQMSAYQRNKPALCEAFANLLDSVELEKSLA